jgi:hypothetical protein
MRKCRIQTAIAGIDGKRSRTFKRRKQSLWHFWTGGGLSPIDTRTLEPNGCPTCLEHFFTILVRPNTPMLHNQSKFLPLIAVVVNLRDWSLNQQKGLYNSLPAYYFSKLYKEEELRPCSTM